MFPSSRVVIQEISLPRMNMYMIIALCAAKMIPRGSFRDAPTPALSVCRGYRSKHIYHAKLLWRINNTLRILVNLNDKLRVSTDTLYSMQWWNNYYSYECNTGVITFHEIFFTLHQRISFSFFRYRTSERIIRYYFDCSRISILSAFSRA